MPSIEPSIKPYLPPKVKTGLKEDAEHQFGSHGVSLPSITPPIEGWPTSVNSIVAWDGAGLRQEEQYTYVLNADEINEIESALAYFKGLGLDGQEVSRQNFPLPHLSEPLHALAEDLHYGRGFFAIRGLDPNKYQKEDNILIFLGISSYIGDKRGMQDDQGHLFAHICEAKYMEEGPTGRPLRDSNRASAFHTDLFSDILAMQTRTLPIFGGNHIVASSAKVYNELVKARPDLIPVLAAPSWPYDTRGKLTPPASRPLLYFHDSRILLNFVRDPLTGVPGVNRPASLPQLTPLQLEALDAVQELAAQHARPLAMRPGDLTFVNNMTVLHARDGFIDAPASRTRYLVRMWLKSTEMALALPPDLEAGNRRVFGDEDVGVREDWNIVHKPRLTFNIAERLGP